MASSNPPQQTHIHNSLTAAAARPFVTQLSSGGPTNTKKQRVLLRVKRSRHTKGQRGDITPTVSINTALSSSLLEQHRSEDDHHPEEVEEGPAKKRKMDDSTTEIIRLALPTGGNHNPKRKCHETNELASRLSSAVSLYAEADETATTEQLQQPSTPIRGDVKELPISSKTPMKPKRSAIFRKLTDLRKLLHTEDGAANNRDDDDYCKTNTQYEQFRVVDVKLQDTTDSYENNGMISQDFTLQEGTGPRLSRTRPRPNADDQDYYCGGGKKPENKRRKIGLVVEQSRIMSERELWDNTVIAKINASSSEGMSNELLLSEDAASIIDYSLQTLFNQRGGSVFPFLSSLKLDQRLGFVEGTAKGRSMINYKSLEGNSRTVLHYAALWGDVKGIYAALEMGADPTVVDALGHNPAALAELNGHEDALMALLQAEIHTNKDAACTTEDDYYYEVYCLEDDESGGAAAEISSHNVSSAPSQVKVPRDVNNSSPNASSFTTSDSEANNNLMDSPPDLIRMDDHRMSEEEDESCPLIELRNGFGYWNEQGELILEASSGTRQPSSAASSVACAAADDVSDDSSEASIDYPDEEKSDDEIRDDNHPAFDFGNLGSDYEDYLDADAHIARAYDSDDDSDCAGWKLDFRNRFVGSITNGGIQGDNNSEEDELVSGGFATMNRGWEYSDGMSESDDEYTGPMLG